MTVVQESGIRDAEANELITNARAMLEMMTRSGWQELDVAVASGRIMISATGFTPGSAPGNAKTQDIVAPHVATVTWVASAGTVVSAGMPVAKLAVLNTIFELEAMQAATVAEVNSAPGELVEFGQILLQLA